jgi:hypothetical protein
MLLLWLWPYLMAVIAGAAALDYSLKVRMGGPALAAGYNVYGGLSHTDGAKSMLLELRYALVLGEDIPKPALTSEARNLARITSIWRLVK